jgi:hypothetical protein
MSPKLGTKIMSPSRGEALASATRLHVLNHGDDDLIR